MSGRIGLVALLPAVAALVVACGDSGSDGGGSTDSGGSAGGGGSPPAGGGTGGGTGGTQTGGSSGVQTGGSGGVQTGGSSGATTGGSSGAATGGSSGAATGGSSGAATGGSSGSVGCGPGECEFVPAAAHVVQTSKLVEEAMVDSGNLAFADPSGDVPLVAVDPTSLRQEIVGFGASFTESSAYVLQQIDAAARTEVLNRIFGPDGAGFSLMRAPIGSSDFGLTSYSYAAEADLSDFSLAEDEGDIIPLIQDSMAVSRWPIKVLSSPWSAPPFMKDTGEYFNTSTQDGGRLLVEHYPTFSDYIVRYIQGYADHGIPIWAITPENEPGGCDGQWESMEFTPETMAAFIDVLAPAVDAAFPDVKLIVHDHNRDNAEAWVSTIMADPGAAPYVDGTGLHWYSSTFLVYEEVLDNLHDAYGADHLLMNTEGSVGLGSHPPPTDWWQWWWAEDMLGGAQSWNAIPANFAEYTPIYRVIRDIAVGLNHWYNGWIAWNLALDHEGYPRHAGGSGNTAPVMIDRDTDEIHYTPYLFAIEHFSRFMQPGARVLATTAPDYLLAASAWNPDGTIAVVVANISAHHPDDYPSVVDRDYRLQIGTQVVDVHIPAHSIQTLVVTPAAP